METSKPSDQMEAIGIIAAMPQETNALLHLIKERKWTRLGSYRCHHFQLSKRNCWLITSGMGLQRAAQATRTLVDATSSQLLVSFGVAGAVGDNLEIGDVVASRNTCLLDQGLLGQFQSLALLSETAWQAVVQALQPRQVSLYTGTAITTRGSQFIQRQPEQLTNPVLEMETSGIAGVTAEQGIPLLSLRAISDGPSAPIPFDLEAMLDEDYNLRIWEILKTVLNHPRMLPRLLKMGQNTEVAADNAAIALVAALSQPGPVISI